MALVLILCCHRARAVDWLPFGPDGGHARSLVADPRDPKHLYLGATNGWMFVSSDGGKIWKRLAQVGRRDDLVLDNIVVDAADSNHLIVGAWVLGSTDGGVYGSHDAGVTWTSSAGMAGQSVRALTASVSDPKVLVAGTLQGVYRSEDGGVKWTLISPGGSREIHEVESIAIDPVDSKIVYAGTWHLPWKTTDGGAHWNNIKEGVIDDSDVFSIIVDPKQPNVVFASACSGIYKSENAGGKFKKIQGIPSTARRTRVLMQDPQRLETVFAGTTEGLYRSDDNGDTWVRTTGPELIVNDVYVDPSDSTHVLIATERAGVLSSHDRGNSFDPSNAGFSTRQITSFLTDARRPSNVYVGVVNDKEWGGVFASENGGLSWVQESAGLGGRDVFSLGQASDGTILAGTSHGIYRLDGAMWGRAGGDTQDRGAASSAMVAKPVAMETEKRLTAGHAGKTPTAPKTVSKVRQGPSADGFDGGVYAIARAGDRLYAASSEGLLTSGTAGQHWEWVAALEGQGFQFVAVARNVIVAADMRKVVSSSDGGKTWREVKLPASLAQVSAVAADGSGAIWVGGREGAFATTDGGVVWDTPRNVSIRDVNSLYYDPASERVIITVGGRSGMAYAVHVPDHTVKFWDTGWNLRFARPVGDHLVAATMFDGIVVQPQMVDSAEVPSHQSAQVQAAGR